MSREKEIDPYAGNMLIEPLGPILSPKDAVRGMTRLPQVPTEAERCAPFHIRRHLLLNVRDLHLPSAEEIRLQESVDLAIRRLYKFSDPKSPRGWTRISSADVVRPAQRPPAMSIALPGHSGTGKTAAVAATLDLMPPVVVHPEFPRINGPHVQVVYLTVQVPASGRLEDFAWAITNAWESTFETHAPNFAGRFDRVRRSRRGGALGLLEEWQPVAKAHCLGILWLDEIQNLFKLPTLEDRRKQRSESGEIELRVVDDALLKWLINLSNEGSMAVGFSGTPDGFGALGKRVANLQRLVSGGYHPLKPYASHNDKAFNMTLLPQLIKRQWVETPIVYSQDLAELVFKRTAGVHRLIIALWICAHRVAFDANRDALTIDDFASAAQTYLAPVQPAVEALLSGEPRKMAKYEDLVRLDDGFWESIWRP